MPWQDAVPVWHVPKGRANAATACGEASTSEAPLRGMWRRCVLLAQVSGVEH